MPGGLFYISYNVKAGWERVVPLRDLLAQYYKSHRSGTVVDRMNAAFAFAAEMLEADAKFFAQNPIAKAQLNDMKKKDPIYLAHEFFNETWDPMSFSEVCDALAPAKLEHLGSSTLLDGVEAIHLQQKFMLIKHAENLPGTIKGAHGTANLDQDLYGWILRTFSEDNGYTLSVKDILTSPVSQPLTYTQIDQALRVLVDLGMLAPISPAEAMDAARPRTERMNAKLCRDAAFDDSVKYLASPVIGTGGPSVAF